MDFDPDGLCIYNTYRVGSQALAHERDLVVGGLKLMGLRSGDAFWGVARGADVGEEGDGDGDGDGGVDEGGEVVEFQFLSMRERQRGRGLLGRLVVEIASSSAEDELQTHMLETWNWQDSNTKNNIEKRASAQVLKREIQICLLMGYKVELETLERRPGGLESWLLSQQIHN